MTSLVLPAVVAVLICVVVTYILYVCHRRKRTTVLLLGICESGKTALFSNLTTGKCMPSHTSLKENIGTVQGKAEVLSVVDIPGHEKIRYESLEKYKSNTRGFVFVVDSKNIQTELKDVAEFLYNILTDPRVSHSGNRILIACNKQDSSSAKGCSVVRSLLEKELNTLTITRIGALAGLEQGTNVKPVTLTKPGINFTFASSRLPVDFVECSAVSDISPIKEWLHRI